MTAYLSPIERELIRERARERRAWLREDAKMRRSRARSHRPNRLCWGWPVCTWRLWQHAPRFLTHSHLYDALISRPVARELNRRAGRHAR